MLPFLAFCISILALGSCVNLGPEFQPPDLGDTVAPSYQYAGDLTSRPRLDDQWWESFGDPLLNRLVEEALLNNWDIKKATARVLEARSRLVQSHADRLPRFDLEARAQRQRQASVSPFGTGTSRETTKSHVLSIPASFELDLWGRLAKTEEAARAELAKAREDRLTIAQSIVAETITLYFQIESLERRIQITLESIRTYRLSLKVVENRYRRGLISVLDVRQARRLLAQTEALLPPLRQQLGTLQQRLAVLVGRYPETRPARTHSLDYFKHIEPVPPGVPSELLRRRPDIRASEAALVALNALVGVAKANRFPRISLTGTYGYSSDELNQLLDPSSELSRIAAGLVMPLFDAGKLKAAQQAAEARYRQGLADYAKNVLNAFSEVERALLTRKEQLERRKKILEFLAEARATQQVAQNRYMKGLVNYINVLDAQQTRFQAEQNLVAVDQDLLINRVNLYRALGGGWGDPGPVRSDTRSKHSSIEKDQMP
ncbi:MAG: efflux transporter outer membrane subunit [Deltaproteobacteria bacterium]|nr:efflux transporter outer membrane subunit [Deltaproteobacteria bacterium]